MMDQVLTQTACVYPRMPCLLRFGCMNRHCCWKDQTRERYLPKTSFKDFAPEISAVFRLYLKILSPLPG
jgi:hypothetical protein